MRNTIREVLRLYHAAGPRIRTIAGSLRISPATVGDNLHRAERQGLTWPQPESLDDATLERRLLVAPPPKGTPRPLPDWSEVHCEPGRKGVTLTLLWHEYKPAHLQGLWYSRFCEFGSLLYLCR